MKKKNVLFNLAVLRLSVTALVLAAINMHISRNMLK
jgi:hypothetical protein